MENMKERVSQLEFLTAEIFQRMDVRDARQDKLNSLLSVISVAAVIMASLSFIATFYIIFS